ncbi:MAG: AMP-dependent synthetase/ligase [Solirubrobacteraceae bacterium]|nr:AMP-dependent synthetase/ligase [Patulibacter sp.]
MSATEQGRRPYWWRTSRPETLADITAENARRFPDRVAFEQRVGSQWLPVTSAEFHDRVQTLAAAFLAAGINAGDRVGLMSETRFEWTLVDVALWTAGAIVVPIYPTSSPGQVSWILEDSGAIACVFENRSQVEFLAGHLGTLERRWLIDGDAEGTTTIADLVERSRSDDHRDALSERRQAIRPDAVATIIYTSGTTGHPKGCAVTHANFLAEVESALDGLEAVFCGDEASTLLFLPLAHVFGRMIEIAVLLAGIRTGHTSVGRVSIDLPTFRPTFVLAVPRVFERMFEGVRRKAAREGKGRTLDAAIQVAVEYSQASEGGGKPSAILRLRHRVYERFVYARIRAAFGGELRWGISGGAPLSPRLGHAFRGIGLTVLEGYGMTETTAATTTNTPEASRIGTVGRPLPGFDVRIDDAGEILVRGAHVFGGYWGDRAADAEPAAADAWFRTGDLGALDDAGYLTITGRLKELIVTSTGKNVSPAPLEDLIRAHPLISQAMIIGDAQPFLAALVTIDPDGLELWLAERKRPQEPVSALVQDPELLAEIDDAITAANSTVSSAESIGRFRILPLELTVADGHLTPTLKVRRGAVLKTFAADVAALYPRAEVVPGADA